MKINKLMLGLVAISVLVTSYLFQSLDFSLDDKLIIGVANGYAPFVSMNHLGEYEGFDIDIVSVGGIFSGFDIVSVGILSKIGTTISAFFPE